VSAGFPFQAFCGTISSLARTREPLTIARKTAENVATLATKMGRNVRSIRYLPKTWRMATFRVALRVNHATGYPNGASARKLTSGN
jgi:hypothetical protein